MNEPIDWKALALEAKEVLEYYTVQGDEDGEEYNNEDVIAIRKKIEEAEKKEIN